MCQICTIAVIGGLGLSRWLEVDDTISGIWIGALIVSLVYWTLSFLQKRKLYFWGRDFFVSIIYFASVIIPLYFGEIIGHKLNRLWGIDKFIVGLSVGSLIFIIAIAIYRLVKIKNHGRAHFPFEKVLIPIISLCFSSFLFYLITR